MKEIIVAASTSFVLLSSEGSRAEKRRTDSPSLSWTHSLRASPAAWQQPITSRLWKDAFLFISAQQRDEVEADGEERWVLQMGFISDWLVDKSGRMWKCPSAQINSKKKKLIRKCKVIYHISIFPYLCILSYCCFSLVFCFIQHVYLFLLLTLGFYLLKPAQRFSQLRVFSKCASEINFDSMKPGLCSLWKRKILKVFVISALLSNVMSAILTNHYSLR